MSLLDQNLSYGRSFMSKTGTATYTYRDEEMYLPLPCTLTLSFSTVLSNTLPLSSLVQNAAIWDMGEQECAAHPAPTSPTTVKTSWSSLTTPSPTTSMFSQYTAPVPSPEVHMTSNGRISPSLTSMTQTSTMSTHSKVLSLDFTTIC